MDIYFPSRKARQRFPFALFGFTVLLFVSGFILFIKETKKTVLSPVVAYTPSPKPLPKLHQKPDESVLSQAVATAFDDSITDYSLIVDDFKSGFRFELGDQSIYTAASVLKLPILISVYAQQYSGSINLTKTITIATDDIQDYGTGTIRYEGPGATHTIAELAEFMIKQSDNTAAYVLGRKVLNFANIQSAINSWGLKETNMEENMTSNRDMESLFKQLFLGQLLPPEATRNVIELLSDSDFEDRLPALLPKRVRVYHKVGSTIGGLHDVGVVMGDHSLYYIGIFTRDVSDEDRATKAIARISKVVYDVLEKSD